MMKTALKHKNVILGVCGGIAAYKSVEILRRLAQSGASVRVIMTRSAQWFVGALTFEALSGLQEAAEQEIVQILVVKPHEG